MSLKTNHAATLRNMAEELTTLIGKYSSDAARCPEDAAFAMRMVKSITPDHAALLAGAAALEAVGEAKAALLRIHKGTCLTAQESRSRDEDRYCLADVMNVAAAALAKLEAL